MRIVVTGLAATYPLGGVFWDYLQYALAFQEFGHQVLYFEDSGRWCYDPIQQTMTRSGATAASWLERQIEVSAPSLNGRWFFRDAAGATHGASLERVEQFLKSADLILNISGASKFELLDKSSARLALIDTDPMYTQALFAANESRTLAPIVQKRLNRLRSHDALLTFGERIASPDCLVPTGSLTWIPTRQPVALSSVRSHAKPSAERRRTTTTVASWDRYTKPITVNGVRYYGKSRQFRQLLRFPRATDIPVEIAMSGKAPRKSMDRNGWRLVDAADVSRTAAGYLSYLADSFAEWSVAKHAYVASRSGWFSCRSACYLALGVPVIVEETGFSKFLPAGEGVLAFSTLDEAVAAVEAVQSNYERHCRAAREIAEEYFDSRKVLAKLLDDIFASPTGTVTAETPSVTGG